MAANARNLLQGKNDKNSDVTMATRATCLV
jgi:hypothetical protein